MSGYFGDRERGAKPRFFEEVTQEVWAGIVSIVNPLIENGSFGLSFSLRAEHFNSLDRAAAITEIDLGEPRAFGSKPPIKADVGRREHAVHGNFFVV